MEQNKKQEVHTHKIGIYLWIWGLLFVFSFFSYMVDYMEFQGLLRWTLIVFYAYKGRIDNGDIYALILGTLGYC